MKREANKTTHSPNRVLHLPANPLRFIAAGDLGRSAKGIITMAIVACLVISTAEAQEIYKWVDEKGVTHYSDTPPPDKQSKDIDTVKGDKVVSPVRTTTIQSDKTEPSATGQTTTQQPAQVDVWVDEYGNRHPITEELIAQETARLQEKLRYYEHDCIDNYKGLNSGNGAFDLRAKDEHKRWCEHGTESVKQELRELAKSPKMYFYKKGQAKNKIVNPHTGEEIPFDGGVGSYGNYYIRTEGGYINTTNNEFISIK
jgi:hypothetical protein